MAYSTRADVLLRFPLLSNVPLTPTDVITTFIAQADDEIDHILAGRRYVVPVASPDDFLKKWSVLKAGLASWSSLDATSQTMAFNFDWVQSEIEKIEGAIVSGMLTFAYPKYTSQPAIYSDSLTDSTISNFNTDVDVTNE